MPSGHWVLDSEFYGLLAMQVKSAQFTAEEWHHTISFWNCNFPLFSLVLISGMGPAYMLCTPKENQWRGTLLFFFMLPGYQTSEFNLLDPIQPCLYRNFQELYSPSASFICPSWIYIEKHPGTIRFLHWIHMYDFLLHSELRSPILRWNLMLLRLEITKGISQISLELHCPQTFRVSNQSSLQKGSLLSQLSWRNLTV